MSRDIPGRLRFGEFSSRLEDHEFRSARRSYDVAELAREFDGTGIRQTVL